MLKPLGKTDAQIQQDVMREFKWDTRIEPTDVGVEVDEGIVTLTGTVKSWAQRLAAAEAAHRVRGVLDVANDIKVQFPGTLSRTDTDIARAVRNALEWDVLVPEERIRSTVSDGNVTLEGDVSFGSQREDAERAVRNLMSVKHLLNLIEVKPPPIKEKELRTAIAEALERQADRDADRVNLVFQDGSVTLSGAVRSWTERQAVVGAVRGTPGVRTVHDRLHIQY